MRSVGLDVDGPVRWGTTPSSREPGIFTVELDGAEARAPIDEVEVRRWLERVPDLRLDGERPTESTLAARLASFWLPGQTLLYVGRSAKALGGRVGALYATELGHRRPHAGGHWLRTLRNPGRLVIWWAGTDAAEEYEDALLDAFGASFSDEDRTALEAAGPLLPWANLESATGEARRTGISAPLIDGADGAARASAVRRSDRSPAPRRRAPATSSAPRAPRRAATTASSAASREQPTHLTSEGLEALRSELEQLVNVERPQVVERVKLARELGDLRENADYEAARREQSFLEGRIQELERRLRTAVVIEGNAAGGSGGNVSLGSKVRFELDGQADELTIVGSTESDPSAGRISSASPVGRALLGHRAGDEVVVRTPAAEIRYRIIEVA